VSLTDVGSDENGVVGGVVFVSLLQDGATELRDPTTLESTTKVSPGWREKASIPEFAGRARTWSAPPARRLPGPHSVGQQFSQKVGARSGVCALRVIAQSHKGATGATLDERRASQELVRAPALRKRVDLPDWVEVPVAPPLKSDVATPSDWLLFGRRPFPDVQVDGPGPENGHIECDNQVSHAHDCRSSYKQLLSRFRRYGGVEPNAQGHATRVRQPG